MCGIFGFVTGAKRHISADDFVAQSLIASSIRGTDGAGVASINTIKKASAYQKLPLTGSMLLQDKYAQQLLRAANNIGTITIGHNRSATSGLISLNETHPFFVSYEGSPRELIGVHNGTLTGWQSKPGAKDYTVDSEWALNHIFDRGMKAFEDFNGPYCFVWWDSEEADMLNVALNEDRPMCVGFTEDDGMGYASEPGMLQWLFERNNIKRKGPIMRLAGKHWYKFQTTAVRDFAKESLPYPKTHTVVRQTSSSYQNAYTRTHIEQVEELLTRIGKMGTSKPATALVLPALRERVKLVTPEELEAADALLMRNEIGKFIPIHLDEETHELIGTYQSAYLGEMDGIIRNVSSESKPEAEYDVVCLGIKDEAKSLVAVCRFGKIIPITKPIDVRIKPETSVMH